MADLDGTIFAYDYRVRLPHLSTRHSYHTCGCNKSKFPRVDGRKSWRMLVAHDSRKQKSYRQNLAYSLFKTTFLIIQHGCPQNPRKAAVI